MIQQRVAVIGCGVWGRNIVRNFYNLNVLDTVCDIDEENLKKLPNSTPVLRLHVILTTLLTTKQLPEFVL